MKILTKKPIKVEGVEYPKGTAANIIAFLLPDEVLLEIQGQQIKIETTACEIPASK